MKNILFLITLFITVVLSACFDDKGNYDYHEINELQITGLPEELQVKYRNVDTLRATPVLKQRLTTAVCRIGIVLNGKLCPN